MYHKHFEHVGYTHTWMMSGGILSSRESLVSLFVSVSMFRYPTFLGISLIVLIVVSRRVGTPCQEA